VDERTREELAAENALLRERIGALEAEVEMLRSMLSGAGKGSSAAPFIKPNRAQRREAERKKRKHSCGRKRDVATEEVIHVLEKCPNCGRELCGGWEYSRRQVIEIPQTPVRIIEHVVMARRCGACGKVQVPKLTIADGVVGKMRVGVNLMSLIATLSIAKRMPQRTIQKLLDGLYGLHISVGEINEVLHRVSEWSRPTVAGILGSIRGSPEANADETGWREDGINGYLWSLSTKTARFYYFHRRRASRIIRHILGGKFGGVLGCDFYVGYDWYLGPKQRCWVHLLRDLAKLVDEQPSADDWAEMIKGIWKSAKKVARRADLSAQARVRLREQLQTKLFWIVQGHAAHKGCPQHKLAKRICRYLPELFTFVEHPHADWHNNAAERAIRPAVIARKVSGGTRSARGSQTRTRLMSIFATWALQGKEPIAACAEMIISSQKPAIAPVS